MARVLELEYQRAPYTRRAPACPPAAQQPAGGAAPLGSAADVAQRTALAHEGGAHATVLAMAPAVAAGDRSEARESAGVRAAAAGACMVCDAASPKSSAMHPRAGAWPRGGDGAPASAALAGSGLGPAECYTAVAPLMRDTAAAIVRCAGLLPGGPDARMPTRVQLEALGAPLTLPAPGIMLASDVVIVLCCCQGLDIRSVLIPIFEMHSKSACILESAWLSWWVCHRCQPLARRPVASVP